MLDHLDLFIYSNGDLALMLKVEVAEKGEMIHLIPEKRRFTTGEGHIQLSPKNFLESRSREGLEIHSDLMTLGSWWHVVTDI